jgi:hypothetical protein
MIVYPAIDLWAAASSGSRRASSTASPPMKPAPRRLAEFASAGAQWAHIVDLDGARAGAPRQHDLLASSPPRRRSSSRSPAAFASAITWHASSKPAPPAS